MLLAPSWHRLAMHLWEYQLRDPHTAARRDRYFVHSAFTTSWQLGNLLGNAFLAPALYSCQSLMPWHLSASCPSTRARKLGDKVNYHLAEDKQNYSATNKERPGSPTLDNSHVMLNLQTAHGYCQNAGHPCHHMSPAPCTLVLCSLKFPSVGPVVSEQTYGSGPVVGW